MERGKIEAPTAMVMSLMMLIPMVLGIATMQYGGAIAVVASTAVLLFLWSRVDERPGIR